MIEGTSLDNCFARSGFRSKTEDNHFQAPDNFLSLTLDAAAAGRLFKSGAETFNLTTSRMELSRIRTMSHLITVQRVSSGYLFASIFSFRSLYETSRSARLRYQLALLVSAVVVVYLLAESELDQELLGSNLTPSKLFKRVSRVLPHQLFVYDPERET